MSAPGLRSHGRLLGAGLAAAVALMPHGAAAAGFDCKGKEACEARMGVLIDRLAETTTEMRRKVATATVLEDLRAGVLTGKRIELPSAQRQHLEQGSPLMGQVTFDMRHRPISTNVSRHFKSLVQIGGGSEVRFQSFLALKRQSAAQKAGPSAVLVTVDASSKLAIWDLEGKALLEDFDLGHGDGRTVSQLALSPSQDNHFVLTADDAGDVRVHNLKIVGVQKDKKAAKDEQSKERRNTELTISTNFSCSFALPPGPGGEQRKLTSVVPVERGSQTFFIAGDHLGGIAVFYRNGTMKGRARISEDPGGILGMQRAQGQSILFFSAYSFGFFSPSQLDVQYPACTGWNSPLFDIALDPASSSNRVILALADGDVIVFSTTSGKSKVCDLALKFPHVSSLPFKLHAFKGHIMGLPTPLPDTPNEGDFFREIYFFNLAAMDGGYGVSPSRAVALQASFKPRQPDSFALTSSPPTQDRGKSYIAIKFMQEKGIELFELNLKQPTAQKAAAAGGGGGGGEESGWASWLNWFPKAGVFGMTLIGVIIWNVRKVANQQGKGSRSGGGGGGMDDFDEDFFKERRKRIAAASGAASGSAGDRPKVEEVGGDGGD